MKNRKFVSQVSIDRVQRIREEYLKGQCREICDPFLKQTRPYLALNEQTKTVSRNSLFLQRCSRKTYVRIVVDLADMTMTSRLGRRHDDGKLLRPLENEKVCETILACSFGA